MGDHFGGCCSNLDTDGGRCDWVIAVKVVESGQILIYFDTRINNICWQIRCGT